MLHVEFTLSYIQLYFILISLFSFALYTYDKLQALHPSKNRQRVSEIKLLLSSLIGGTVGSLFAMLLFRHKIKKASFLIKFFIVIVIQIVVGYFYIQKMM